MYFSFFFFFFFFFFCLSLSLVVWPILGDLFVSKNPKEFYASHFLGFWFMHIPYVRIVNPWLSLWHNSLPTSSLVNRKKWRFFFGNHWVSLVIFCKYLIFCIFKTSDEDEHCGIFIVNMIVSSAFTTNGRVIVMKSRRLCCFHVSNNRWASTKFNWQQVYLDLQSQFITLISNCSKLRMPTIIGITVTCLFHFCLCL